MPSRRGLLALLAVVGPGVLAGLSDDDPPGITTYSVLGADYGYRLLWVLLVSVVALVLFHELGARIGAVTGQGLAGLIRERYGVRLAGVAIIALVVANLGTTCAEFAGIGLALDLFDVPRALGVPVAAVAVSVLVLRGGFRRVEHLLLALSAVFAAYVAAGILAHPDWGAAARGLVVPSLPGTRAAALAAVATVGTTLAPWGLAFIQSYAVDKRLTPADLRFERVDVLAGAIMTGVIGVLVVVACAATLHPAGRHIEDARDAAAGLAPLAGHAAATLFGAGLLGAGLLAASILPLSTAYSVSEVIGVEAALDDGVREAPVFYATYAVVVVAAVVAVLLPGAPLVPILVLSQALNAVLLLPILLFVFGIARDRHLMGEYAMGRRGSTATAVAIAFLCACLAALLVLTVSG